MFDYGADLQNAYDEGYKKGKADAVRHGRWMEDKGRTEEIYVHPVTCSICGQTECLEWGIYTAYCPNCGARMNTCKHYDDDWCSGACDSCERNPSYWERKDDE